MARCGCSGASCSCFIIGQGGITVTGAGSSSNQYIISSDLNVAVVDTATLNMTKSGDGSAASPFTFQGDVTLTLDGLTDVSTAGGATGNVLAKQADGSYSLVPATTAPAGALSIGDGLTGDASSGNKLRVLLAPSSGLTVGPTGLAMQGGGVWSTYTPVQNATTTNPALGNGQAEGYYAQTGKTVSISIEFTIGSTSTRGVGSWGCTLPVPPATNRRQLLAAQVWRVGVAEYSGHGIVINGKVNTVSIASASTSSQNFSHSVPATLPAGSLITISGQYEAA
jgi:hypothetical protein